MAEPVKNGKVSLRDILKEIKDDEAFSERERDRAREELNSLDYCDTLRSGDNDAKS